MKKLTKVELVTLDSLMTRAVQNGQPIPCAYPITAPHVVTTGVEGTLDQRGARYGDFSDHAVVAQTLQDAMRRAATSFGCESGCYELGWGHLSSVQKQALTVIADKIARILNGDPNYADNWHDIQGYAKLVEDRLPKAE